MVKANLKNIAISLALLSLVIVILAAVDSAINLDVAQSETYLRVTVVDLSDSPVHNAQISVAGERFYTDNKGLSPNIQLVSPENSYNGDITEWYTVNVVVVKEGFVPAVVVNCVVYDKQTRRLTVKIYPKDNSELPYVCYVESPPNDFLEQLIGR